MIPGPDDEHLNSYELWARDRLEPLLGRLRVVDQNQQGGGPGLHDFEADLPDGSTAAIEVTSEVESMRRDQESSAGRRFSSFTLRDSRSLWLVGLTAAARVNAISHTELHRLLSDMQTQGRQSAHDLSDYRDPFVERLRALGIESVYAVAAKAGYEGTVMVRPGVYGGWGWDGSAIAAWLADFLASGQGVNKLEKLQRADATERHLVIVLDPFSQAGIGISLGLTAQVERGPADYVIPSLVPTEPLTHLWLLPMFTNWAGLCWARDSGWVVLTG